MTTQHPNQPGWLPQQPPAPPTPPPKPKRSRGQKILLAVVGAVLGLWAIGTMASEPEPTTVPVDTQASATTQAPVTTERTAATKATEATAAPTTAKPKPKLTMSQEQAIGTAESYLDTAHFSRSGLINQLKFEGYSKSDATFAVDYLHVNWREQAVGTAEDYLDTSNFSRSGLINQLKFEGFSQADAAYAASKVGL